jgi:sigma-B regulation protein RsbU (phosphoserine phosphatase)
MAEGDVSAQQLVEKVEEAVKTFVGDAEQSDDLTMLALKYTGLS